MKLAEIKDPAQLKALSLAELTELAEELRQTVLETVARTGGHLAPNLGVVEITLALHTVFDSPRDKILWDVSHQSYIHKLLTGRLERFGTLRQFRGIAGFTHPEESEHDHFHWGHASTSISAAVGMAKARDLCGESHEVIAVIGDGALTGGMAYEALDHAGHEKAKVIVVLNDNSMSISPNVGGISNYLARIRTGPMYRTIKSDVADMLKWASPWVFEMTDRFKEGVKHLLMHNMFFEELGWTYLGPYDGHNLPVLQDALRSARSYPGPVIVHVVTTKGKGVPYAEELPDKYHGLSAFEAATGRTPPSTVPSYSEVASATLAKLAETEPRLVAVTAAMAPGTALNKFAVKFPDRCFDVGIAEQHATTFCAGLAKSGMRPVFAVYSTFLQRGYDQVIHDVAIQNLPVVFAIDRAGLVEDGATHQGVFDVAYLRVVPNLTVMAPKDENELQHMLCTALQLPGPAAIRYPRTKVQGVAMDPSLRPLPLGRGEVVRPGRDLAIIALGTMVYPALQAAEALASQGIDVQVINPRFVKPLDQELILAAAGEVAGFVTVEECALAGGFGSAVLETLAAAGVALPVERLGVPDRFVPHGAPRHFHQEFGLTPDGIAAACQNLWQRLHAELPQPVRRPGRRRPAPRAANEG